MKEKIIQEEKHKPQKSIAISLLPKRPTSSYQIMDHPLRLSSSKLPFFSFLTNGEYTG